MLVLLMEVSQTLRAQQRLGGTAVLEADGNHRLFGTVMRGAVDCGRGALLLNHL